MRGKPPKGSADNISHRRYPSLCKQLIDNICGDKFSQTNTIPSFRALQICFLCSGPYSSSRQHQLSAGQRIPPLFASQPGAQNPQQRVGLVPGGAACPSDAKWGNCCPRLCPLEVWLRRGTPRQGRACGARRAAQMEEWLHNSLPMFGAFSPRVIYASPAPNADNEHVLRLLCECRAVKEQQAAIKLQEKPYPAVTS